MTNTCQHVILNPQFVTADNSHNISSITGNCVMCKASNIVIQLKNFDEHNKRLMMWADMQKTKIV